MLQSGMSCPAVEVFPGGISESQTNAILDDLLSVFNHRMSWISEMSPSALNSAPAVGGSGTVGGALPFVYSMTCNTGSFDGAGRALSEEWIIPNSQTPTSPRGAIGCAGLWGSGAHAPYNKLVAAAAT